MHAALSIKCNAMLMQFKLNTALMCHVKHSLDSVSCGRNGSILTSCMFMFIVC
jgi:hypothetical protein